jgi:hypothetical protein
MFLNLLSHLPWEKLQKKLLVQAIKSNNIDYIKSYIKKDYLHRFQSDEILHLTLEHNATSIFKLLLKQEGFNINSLNKKGNSILGEILIHHKFKCLEYLWRSKYAKELDFTTSCIVKEQDDNHLLGEYSCQTIIFANLNVYIQQFSLIKLTNMIKNSNINFNIADNLGNVVLGYLMNYKQTEIFEYVLSKTQNMYQINHKKENLLHLAFASGNIDYVESLIDYHFDILANTEENKSYEDIVADLNYANKVSASICEQMYILIENKINALQEFIKRQENGFITNDPLITPLKKII